MTDLRTYCGALVRLLLLLATIATITVAAALSEECVVGDDGTCLSSEATTGSATDDECIDDHVKCKVWAERGECIATPRYMLRNCRVSCGTCNMEESKLLELINPRNDEDDEDEDDLSATPYGVKQKVNHEKARLMLENMTDYMENRVFQEEKYVNVKDRCKNSHRECAAWAAKGECEANPKYMLLRCAPMCQTCEYADFEARCPLDLTAPQILQPGDLHEIFTNLTTMEHYKQYDPVILSMPKENASPLLVDAAGRDDIQDGPWVVVLENFLTEEECDRLIELGAQQGYKFSAAGGKVKPDGTYAGSKTASRTSTNAWCKKQCHEDPMTQSVIAKIENVTGVPDSHAEYLQMLRYETGQFYRTHHDYIAHHLNRQEGARIITVFLYLNDVEAGGGTEFPLLDKLTVMPKKGKALIWPSVLN
eukprot:CAMPEP_0194069488 /NCGR_PEP_ID=MMETSP0009_2-20130614/87666_1 /TAXON_ID=210454 /ORGANISM="Grammatophora oceanica, Strain CCMP 410" /LENGTH=421 /DNA_ID=CAMNT_0038722679 /DNA_START=46 /DNA_END=1311 /DNA_ORIENTATION=-